MKKIIHCLNVKVSPGAVFPALTTETGLASWWSTKVKAEARIGGIVDFTFIADFNPNMKVTSLEDPSLVAWECVSGHPPWANNTFRFALKETDGGTQVMFTQDYAQELSDEVYGVYNYNWGYYLESLRLYCETGTGKPFEGS